MPGDKQQDLLFVIYNHSTYKHMYGKACLNFLSIMCNSCIYYELLFHWVIHTLIPSHFPPPSPGLYLHPKPPETLTPSCVKDSERRRAWVQQRLATTWKASRWWLTPEATPKNSEPLLSSTQKERGGRRVARHDGWGRQPAIMGRRNQTVAEATRKEKKNKKKGSNGSLPLLPRSATWLDRGQLTATKVQIKSRSKQQH